MEEEMTFCELRFVHVEFHNHHQLSFISESHIRMTHVFRQVEEETVAGFLKATVTPYRDRDRIFYDIHGYRPLTETDFTDYKYEDWRNLFMEILTIADAGNKHLLEGRHTVFEPKFVFLKKGKRQVGLLYNEEYEVPFAEGITSLAGWFLAHHRPEEDKTILLFFHFYHGCATDCDIPKLLEEIRAQVYLERDELLKKSIRSRAKEIASEVMESRDKETAERGRGKEFAGETLESSGGYMGRKRALKVGGGPGLQKRFTILKNYYLPDSRSLGKVCGIVFGICVVLLLGGPVFHVIAMGRAVMIFLFGGMVLSLAGIFKALT